MASIIIVAETGSDITPKIAEQYNIQIVPMHVTFDTKTMDDGSFPPQKIVNFYQNTGKLPTTSGCTPEDFVTVFDRIHQQNPEAKILYLAYSAITTCSYHSAVLAAEGRDYITFMDTRQVSVGQGYVVASVARHLQENPDISMEDLCAFANTCIDRARMCFLPDNLEFLRAGGRVSNVVALGSRILSLRPCIEILEGKLVATKKYRGKMPAVAAQLVQEYTEKYKLSRDCLWLVYTVGLADEVRRSVEQACKGCGYARIQWIQANGVITTHGGPAAFGLAGFSQE